MKEGDVFSELGASTTKDSRKFQIQKRTGGKVTLNWDKFK